MWSIGDKWSLLLLCHNIKRHHNSYGALKRVSTISVNKEFIHPVTDFWKKRVQPSYEVQGQDATSVALENDTQLQHPNLRHIYLQKLGKQSISSDISGPDFDLDLRLRKYALQLGLSFSCVLQNIRLKRKFRSNIVYLSIWPLYEQTILQQWLNGSLGNQLASFGLSCLVSFVGSIISSGHSGLISTNLSLEYGTTDP